MHMLYVICTSYIRYVIKLVHMHMLYVIRTCYMTRTCYMICVYVICTCAYGICTCAYGICTSYVSYAHVIQHVHVIQHMYILYDICTRYMTCYITHVHNVTCTQCDICTSHTTYVYNA